MMFYTLLAVAIITSLSAVFVWRVVNRPLKILGNETDRLAAGRLGHQIQVRSHDEIADPLAGFLTYANLLKKQFARENDKKYDEALASLDLIETDSRRCGEIIKNLLTLAMSHMFEPFFTTKERGHELGLGLAFSRMIVERHQGQIDVESEIWRGTGFTITLPLEGAAATAITAGKQVTQG